MMRLDFTTGERPRARDSIIPMINIVFLMLIFFLMTATLTPKAPIDVEPPDSISDNPVEKRPVLFVAADGQMAFGEVQGSAAFDAFVAAASGAEGQAQIRADRGLAGPRIAAILSRLGTAGIERVKLIVGRG